MLKLLLARKHLLAWSKKYLEPAVSDYLYLLSCYKEKLKTELGLNSFLMKPFHAFKRKVHLWKYSWALKYSWAV